MDIMVKGNASKFFKPEEVEISLVFSNKDKKYDKVLEEGLRNVQDFITDVLGNIGFSKEDLKTNSFNITEQNNYDYKTNKRNFEGYVFVQLATMKFDYDVKKVTKFMELVASLKNPAYYTLKFNVKDLDTCKNLVINDAYIAAKNKATAIAEASNKKLKDCIKTDFRAFSEEVKSESIITSFNKTGNMLMEDDELDSIPMMTNSMVRQEAQIIENTFTPQDVMITEEIYCLWITE